MNKIAVLLNLILLCLLFSGCRNELDVRNEYIEFFNANRQSMQRISDYIMSMELKSEYEFTKQESKEIMNTLGLKNDPCFKHFAIRPPYFNKDDKWTSVSLFLDIYEAKCTLHGISYVEGEVKFDERTFYIDNEKHWVVFYSIASPCF